MRTTILLTAALALTAAHCLADIGKTWTTEGAPAFAAGKLDGVSVLSTGQVELAPEAEPIEGIEADLWPGWDVRDTVIDQLIALKRTYGDFVINPVRDLKLIGEDAKADLELAMA